MLNLLRLLLALPLIGVLILGFLWQPVDAGSLYWLSVGWIIFLICLNWYTTVGILGKASDDGSNSATGTLLGIFPAVGIVTFVYSIVSASSLIAANLQLISSTLHLTIQVIAVVGAGMLAVTMLLAHRGSLIGSETAVHKDQLLRQLNQLSRVDSLEPSAKDLIKEARDYVLYKLPPPSMVDQSKLSAALQLLHAIDSENPCEAEISDVLSNIRSA